MLQDWGYGLQDFGSVCEVCHNQGPCEACNCVDGRYMDVVNEYASTCDWCGEMVMNELQTMDLATQLGYCEKCIPKLPEDIKARLEKCDS